MLSIIETLSKSGTQTIKEARSSLTRNKKNASKKLYNSLDYYIEKTKDSTTLKYQMEEYGEFIDRGVHGKGGTRADGSQWKKKTVTNSPFRYRNAKPPASAFSSWSIRKGIAPRDSKGKFLSRKSVQFALATSVFHTGLETTDFWTKPFEREYKRLLLAIDENLGNDLDNALNNL